LKKEELLYTKDHEWLNIKGEEVEIGISGYAADELGDITFIEFPYPDGEVAEGDELVSIESVKAASSVDSPVDGTVMYVNSKLEDAPEKLADAPFDTVLIKLKFSHIDTSTFLSYDEYKKTLE